MSRKAFVPTAEHRRLARILSGWGLSTRQVAEAVDVSPKTAAKTLATEMAEGAEAHEAARLTEHLTSIERRQRPQPATSSATWEGGAPAQVVRPQRKTTK